MDLTTLLTLMKGAPAEAVAVISAAAGMLAIILKMRSADVEGATSIGKLQQDHLVVLMNQNKQLGDELSEVREKLSATFSLMEDMRRQIVELEELVREYKRRCDTCPGPGGLPPHGMDKFHLQRHIPTPPFTEVSDERL